jgi:hypothetical protein
LNFPSSSTLSVAQAILTDVGPEGGSQISIGNTSAVTAPPPLKCL